MIIESAQVVHFQVFPKNGPLFVPFVLSIVGYVISSLYFLYKNFRHAQKREQSRMIHLFIALMGITVVSVFFSLVLPLFEVPHTNFIGPLSTMAFSIVSGYVLICDDLFDISFAFKKRSLAHTAHNPSSYLQHQTNLDNDQHLSIKSKATTETSSQVLNMYDHKQPHTELQKEYARLQEEHSQTVLDITHHLQTPLTILKSEIVTLRRLKEQLHHADLVELEEHVDRLSEFISRLMYLAHPSSVFYSEELVNVSLQSREIVSYLTTITESSGIDLETSIQENIFMHIDSHAFELMLVNLVSNSVKYVSDERRSWIQLSLFTDDSNIVLKVIDNGQGIPTHTITEIFDAWKRGGTHGISGHGLGLATIKRIVDAHHGTIKVESMVNKETTFTIFLPQKKDSSL